MIAWPRAAPSCSSVEPRYTAGSIQGPPNAVVEILMLGLESGAIKGV